MTSPVETAGSVPGDLTWDEFLHLPDEYRHAELIDGEIVMNPPTSLHQLLVLRLAISLQAWIDAGDGRGEATMEPPVGISERRGYLPDLAWFPPERCAPPGGPPAFVNPPGLAVEVLSPSTRSFDTVRKLADYARIGVSELWLIDPDRPAAVICRHAAGTPSGREFDDVAELGPQEQLSTPLLAGFAVVIGALVRR